jgi:hypothetical protein
MGALGILHAGLAWAFRVRGGKPPMRGSTPELARQPFSSRIEWERALHERRTRSRKVAAACIALVVVPVALFAASVGTRSTSGLVIAGCGGGLLVFVASRCLGRAHHLTAVLRGDDRPMSMHLSWSTATGEEPLALLSLREHAGSRDGGSEALLFAIGGVPGDLVTDGDVGVRVRGLAAGMPMIELRDGRLLWPPI